MERTRRYPLQTHASRKQRRNETNKNKAPAQMQYRIAQVRQQWRCYGILYRCAGARSYRDPLTQERGFFTRSTPKPTVRQELRARWTNTPRLPSQPQSYSSYLVQMSHRSLHIWRPKYLRTRLKHVRRLLAPHTRVPQTCQQTLFV